MTDSEFDTWCEDKASEVCAKWFPLENTLPATALFDIVKVALSEALQNHDFHNTSARHVTDEERQCGGWVGLTESTPESKAACAEMIKKHGVKVSLAALCVLAKEAERLAARAYVELGEFFDGKSLLEEYEAACRLVDELEKK